MSRRPGVQVLATVALLLCARVHADSWQPPAGHTQTRLWPGTPPNLRPPDGPEDAFTKGESRVAGKECHSVENVQNPTFTLFPPKGKNTGAAAIVFPGGGYRILSIDLEGTEVCHWLNSIGITCVLLKYRVPASGPHWNSIRNVPVNPKPHTALQDAQRALGIVRHRAAEWKIDPHKIGVIGFSAGGHLVADISTHLKRIYDPIDDSDKESCRPDFAIALYPGHMSVAYNDLTKVNPDLPFTNEAPPTLLIHAQDDPVDPVEYSLLYYEALLKAKVPVEMHLFATGKHAFGLRPTNDPITKWPSIAETWLKTIGILGERGPLKK